MHMQEYTGKGVSGTLFLPYMTFLSRRGWDVPAKELSLAPADPRANANREATRQTRVSLRVGTGIPILNHLKQRPDRSWRRDSAGHLACCGKSAFEHHRPRRRYAHAARDGGTRPTPRVLPVEL